MWVRSIGVQSWVELAAYVGILAIAAAMLMIAGEFDLSIGANVALGGHTFAMLLMAPGPMPLTMCIFMTFAFMLLVGFVTGSLVVSTGLPSFIVTLGFWFANRGFANYLAFRNHDTSRLDIKPMLEERNVLVDGAVVKMPDPTKIDDIFAFKNGCFGWTGQIDLPGLQPFQLFFNAEFYYFIVFAVVAVYILNFTRIGNWIFAAGGDPVAARAVGVPVARVTAGLPLPSASALPACPLRGRAGCKGPGVPVVGRRGCGWAVRPTTPRTSTPRSEVSRGRHTGQGKGECTDPIHT